MLSLPRASLAVRLAILVLLPGSLALLLVIEVSQRVTAVVTSREVEARARSRAVEASARVRATLKTFEHAAHDLLSDVAAETVRRGEQLSPAAARPILDRLMRVYADVHAIGVVWDRGKGQALYQFIHRDVPEVVPLGAGAVRIPGEPRPAEPLRGSPAGQDQGSEGLLHNVAAEAEGREAFWHPYLRQAGDGRWVMPDADIEGPGAVAYLLPGQESVSHAHAVAQSVVAIVVELPVPRLSYLLQTMSIGNEGVGFLLSPGGFFVGHGVRLRDYQLAPAALRDAKANASGDLAVARPGADRLLARTRFVRLPAGELMVAPSWAAVAPVEGTDWRVGVAESRLANLRGLARLRRGLTWVAVGGGLFLVLGALLLGRSMARPIRLLDAAVENLASGDLERPVPAVGGGEELVRLGRSFEAMRRQVRHHLEQLARVTRERERAESELRIARQIQRSLLPKALPAHDAVDVTAELLPAHEVGGDLYDVQLLDEETLFFAVGDVTDHGVPAAMFMAVTRTVLRSLLHAERSPARLLAQLNDAMAEDNETLMFVTVFAGVLDLRTGLCRYSSGGHNPPLLLPAAGAPRTLDDARGMALGVMAGMDYPEGQVQLTPGDSLFCYTDGVTEAMSLSGEQFGLERTTTAVTADGAEAPIAALAHELAQHAAGAPQSDDITALLIRYHGARVATTAGLAVAGGR